MLLARLIPVVLLSCIGVSAVSAHAQESRPWQLGLIRGIYLQDPDIVADALKRRPATCRTVYEHDTGKPTNTRDAKGRFDPISCPSLNGYQLVDTPLESLSYSETGYRIRSFHAHYSLSSVDLARKLSDRTAMELKVCEKRAANSMVCEVKRHDDNTKLIIFARDESKSMIWASKSPPGLF